MCVICVCERERERERMTGGYGQIMERLERRCLLCVCENRANEWGILSKLERRLCDLFVCVREEMSERAGYCQHTVGKVKTLPFGVFVRERIGEQRVFRGGDSAVCFLPRSASFRKTPLAGDRGRFRLHRERERGEKAGAR